MPSGKKTLIKLLLSYCKLPLQNNSAKPYCFLAKYRCYKNKPHERHRVIWWSIWCISCSAVKCIWDHITVHLYLTPTKLSVTRYASLRIISPTTGVCFSVVQCSSRLWTASISLSLWLLKLILIGSLSSAAQYLMLELFLGVVEAKSELF